ncbi:hypothetical protein NHX12_003764 [Muraenolepis orangiensis]|nr:hypothetical protein NHX12_003764 [Muraenolepis orangiensis]
MTPFKTRLDKLAHQRAHIPISRPYKCPDCAMAFAKLHARNLHLKGHRGQNLSCPHCALVFPTARGIKRHMVVHTGVKQFVCEFCSRSFNQRGHLTSHLRLHTGEKPYRCQHCDERFNHNVSLKSHVMRYHRGASNSVLRMEKEHEKRRTRDTEVTGDNVIDGDPKFKKTYYRSMGRPKGRPKINSAKRETNCIPTVQEEALDPLTAGEPSEEGQSRRAFSKNIESDWSDGDPTSELTEDDEVEEAKAVRKSKLKASNRPMSFYAAEEVLESDSDSDPAEEDTKKRKQAVRNQENRS